MQKVEPPTTIAFIGLGQMGVPMVAQLLAAGFSVRGCDLSEAARLEAAAVGATVFAEPAEAAEDAGCVITMLPNGDVVHDALLGQNGAAGSLRGGSIVVDMSSSSPSNTLALGEELATKGIMLADAPVSGGRKKAVDGSLTIMVGGQGAVVDALMPLLESMGGRIFRTGRLGSGHAMKALNNYVSGAGAVAAMEAVILGREFGLDPELIVDILNVSTGRNNTTELKLKQFVLSGKWGSGFALGLMAKDIGIADHLAKDLGLRLEALTETASRWKQASELLESGADHTEIFRFLERQAKNPA